MRSSRDWWETHTLDDPYIMVMAVFDGEVEEAVKYRYEFGRRWAPTEQPFRALTDDFWHNLRLRQAFEHLPRHVQEHPDDDLLYVPPELMRYTVTLADGSAVDLDAPRFQYGDVRRITVYFHEEAIR